MSSTPEGAPNAWAPCIAESVRTPGCLRQQVCFLTHVSHACKHEGPHTALQARLGTLLEAEAVQEVVGAGAVQLQLDAG